MSYDIYLEHQKCASCGRSDDVEVEYDSPTYNYSAMIRKADLLMGGEGCCFAAIHGICSRQAQEWFSLILQAFRDHENEIRPLEPDNGWGCFDDLPRIFKSYLALCEEEPDAIWRQSGGGSYIHKCCAGWECGREK